MQVITTPIWGEIGDRYGHKGALQFGLLCNALAIALGLVATSPVWFYLIYALIGASTGILFTTTLNLVVEFATPAERVAYIGLHGTLIAPATLVAPLLGGWIAQFAGFRPLFAIAAACGFLGLAILTFLVRDPRHRQVAAGNVAITSDAALS
jgi:MFS family permease